MSSDVATIQSAVRRWSDRERVALLLIGGGGGFEGHACVPEAVAPLLERLAPGLVTVMLDQLHQVRVCVCVWREREGWRTHTGGGWNEPSPSTDPTDASRWCHSS